MKRNIAIAALLVFIALLPATGRSDGCFYEFATMEESCGTYRAFIDRLVCAEGKEAILTDCIFRALMPIK